MIGAATDALKVGGWAVAAGLLAFSPISIFFALNSLSFFLSALFIGSIRHSDGIASDGRTPPRLDEVFSGLRPLSTLAGAVVALGLGVTISAGTWIAAVPEYVRAVLHREAGGFSILMVGYAGGSIAVGALLARVPVENKARASLLAWMLYLPAYGLFLATSVLDGGSRSFPCRIRPDRLGDSPDFSRRKKSDPTCWDA